MEKLVTLCKDSYKEFSKVKVITALAMLGAISLVIASYRIDIGPFIRITFSGIPNQIAYYLFGPIVGGVFGGAMDILAFIMKPTGGYLPGFTLSAILRGILYGVFFYKKKMTFRRILVAELIVIIICNLFLGTLWLNIYYGKAFFAILPMRALKNIIQWPINSFLLFSIVKMLEKSGVIRMIKSEN